MIDLSLDLLSSDHLFSPLWSTVQWPPALTPVIYCPVDHPCDLLSSDHLLSVIYCPVTTCSLWSTVQWDLGLTVIYCPVTTWSLDSRSLWSYCPDQSHHCDDTVQWPPALTPVIYCPVTTCSHGQWSTVQWPPALSDLLSSGHWTPLWSHCPVTGALTPVIYCPVTTCSHCDLLSSETRWSLDCRSTVQWPPGSPLWEQVVQWPPALRDDLLSSDHLLSPLWSTVQWPGGHWTPVDHTVQWPPAQWSTVQWPPALTGLWSTGWEQVSPLW